MNTFRQAGENINVLEHDDTQDNGLPTMMIMQEYNISIMMIQSKKSVVIT